MKRYWTSDTHADTLMRMMDLGYSLSDERLHVSLPKMIESGHDLQIFACFIDPVIGKDRYVTRTLQMIDLLRREARRNRKEMSICASMSEIRKARSEKKKIGMLGLEGGHAIVNDLAVLRAYRRLGILYMTLTWSNTNDWCDSSGDEERWGGLTQFGHDVVREMNRIGMMVDISHVSDKAFWHVLRTSTKPPIASHSSVRKLCNHPRNMTDEMIKALADKGGVIFINFYSAFIHQGFLDAYNSLKRRLHHRLNKAVQKWQHRPELYGYEEDEILRGFEKSLPKVKLQDVVRHIEHVVKIAGVEAVGFGSDFDGAGFMPQDLKDCKGFPLLCDALRKRRFKPSQIDKMAGGNFLRIFSEVVG
jgi:membrane dipeptidase